MANPRRYRLEPPEVRDVVFLLGFVLVGWGIFLLKPEALGVYLLILGIALIMIVAWGLIKTRRSNGMDRECS